MAVIFRITRDPVTSSEEPVREIKVSEGNKVVLIDSIVYTPGSNSLNVHLNGVLQHPGLDYIESGTNQVTFMDGKVKAGDIIMFSTNGKVM